MCNLNDSIAMIWWQTITFSLWRTGTFIRPFTQCMIPPITDLFNILLTGLLMLFVGYVGYSAGHRWFKTFGSHQFGSKFKAQLSIVAVVFITGLMGDPLLAAVQNTTSGLTLLQQFGVVLFVSRVATNGLVPEWTLVDNESMAMYAISGVAVMFGG